MPITTLSSHNSRSSTPASLMPGGARIADASMMQMQLQHQMRTQTSAHAPASPSYMQVQLQMQTQQVHGQPNLTLTRCSASLT